jgi:MOSC domain-containing protein YiiM
MQVSAEPHTGCSLFVERFGLDAVQFVNSPEGRRLRLRGVNAKVIQSGVVQVGDVASVVSRE